MGSPRWLPALAQDRTWNGSEPLDVVAAGDQWSALQEVIERRLGPVVVLDAAPWAQATTFVRDLGVVVDDELVFLRPAGLRGLLEPPVLVQRLAAAGITVDGEAEPLELDGGNVLADHHGRVLVGLCGEPEPGLRAAVDALKQRTGRSAIGVPLAGGRWPHIDMALADLGGRGWLVHPGALGGYDPAEVTWRSLFVDRPVIEVDAEEGDRLACNVVVAGSVVIGPPIGAATRARVEALGFDYESVDVAELAKAGGGVHCLTLELPEAAGGWAATTVASVGRGRAHGAGATTEERKADVRRRILEAARDSFEQFGVAGTRLQDVAAAAGVSRPLLYVHFADRLAIIEASINDELARLVDELRTRIPAGGDFDDCVVELSVASVAIARDDQLLADLFDNSPHRDLATMMQHRDSPAHELVLGLWQPVFELGRATGSLRTDVGDDELIEWIAMAHYAFLLRPDIPLEQVASMIERFVLPGLQPVDL